MTHVPGRFQYLVAGSGAGVAVSTCLGPGLPPWRYVLIALGLMISLWLAASEPKETTR